MCKRLHKSNLTGKATLLSQLGQIPFVGSCLRRFVRLYREGSVVNIKSGYLAGYKWKRSHRYLNGYWLGTYELEIQKCLVRELKQGEVFFDLGANAGFFSLLGSKQVGEKGYVLAFEPLAENIEAIKPQLLLNSVLNCTVVEAAISDFIGEVSLWEGPDTSTAHIGTREFEKKAVKSVKSITLDEFVRTSRQPNFIKMDIEGAEIQALRGADTLLSGPNPPRFLIELHGEKVGQQVVEILEKAGYHLYTLERKRVLPDCMPRHVLAFPGNYVKQPYICRVKNREYTVVLKSLFGQIFRRYRDPYMVRRDALQLIPTFINVGSRAIARKIKINGGKYFKKAFKDTEASAKFFHNEMLANQLFGEQHWKVPIISMGPLWFVSPLLPKEKRLDIIGPKLGEQMRIEIARQAISILFDIFFAGYAHRDFNVKNLFWIDGQLKLVDFEFLKAYPEGKRPAFPLSYDITGQGLESPAFTGNMGYISVKHPKFSLQHVVGVPIEYALEEFLKILKNELRQACKTFKTKRKRHYCGAGRIYSSFELPYFSVKPDESQRDSEVRFEHFGIRKEDLCGKSILDLGSNIGGVLFTAQQYKPLMSFGIEYDAEKTEIAKKLTAYNGLSNVNFIQADIDRLNASSLPGPFDVVFCLAVEAHVKKHKRFFKLLSQVSNGVLYFEGNAKTDSEKVKTTLIREGFGEVRILGVATDDCIPGNNNRPLILARKA